MLNIVYDRPRTKIFPSNVITNPADVHACAWRAELSHQRNHNLGPFTWNICPATQAHAAASLPRSWAYFFCCYAHALMRRQAEDFLLILKLIDQPTAPIRFPRVAIVRQFIHRSHAKQSLAITGGHTVGAIKVPTAERRRSPNGSYHGSHPHKWREPPPADRARSTYGPFAMCCSRLGFLRGRTNRSPLWSLGGVIKRCEQCKACR